MEIKLFFCFGLSVFFDCGSFLDLDINLAKLNLFMVEFYVGLLSFDLYSMFDAKGAQYLRMISFLDIFLFQDFTASLIS